MPAIGHMGRGIRCGVELSCITLMTELAVNLYLLLGSCQFLLVLSTKLFYRCLIFILLFVFYLIVGLDQQFSDFVHKRKI